MAGGTRLPWLVGSVVDAYPEAATARTLVFDVPGWPGHLAGQHLNLRLTAEDGYSAQRSYSLAALADGTRVELTIQRVPDGEVSPYLISNVRAGDPIELRGPVGGWFAWRPERTRPVLLVAGGSGIVPLMAMIRARAAAGAPVPFHLVYSARSPDDVYYAGELRRRVKEDAGLDADVLYTRYAPHGSPRPAGRVRPGELRAPGPPESVDTFVCGPTGFVEAVAETLVDRGHDPATVRTERFGPNG